MNATAHFCFSLLAHAHSPFDAGLGWWEWAIAGACAIAAVWVIWLSIRWTLHPGEEELDHVKRSILCDEEDGAPPARLEGNP